jgi:hypothetical protein
MNCWRFTTDIFSALEESIIDTIKDYNQKSMPKNVNHFEY